MTTFYFILAYLLAGILVSAGHDASSYLMKDKKNNDLTAARVNRWHRDGVLIGILFLLPMIFDIHTLNFYKDWYWTTPACVLLRLSFFDFFFNKWAGLTITLIGGTAWVDRQLVKIFGVNGAVKKSLTFFVLLIGLIGLKIYLHG